MHTFLKCWIQATQARSPTEVHLCIQIVADSSTFYLPLRNNLGADVRKFGRIGHSVPTQNRPQAGIDYRYALIVNDSEYIEFPLSQCIPKNQYQKLLTDISAIETEFGQYVAGFMKAAKKKRIAREPLYRESSLINFMSELGLADTDTTL